MRACVCVHACVCVCVCMCACVHACVCICIVFVVFVFVSCVCVCVRVCVCACVRVFSLTTSFITVFLCSRWRSTLWCFLTLRTTFTQGRSEGKKVWSLIATYCSTKILSTHQYIFLTWLAPPSKLLGTKSNCLMSLTLAGSWMTWSKRLVSRFHTWRKRDLQCRRHESNLVNSFHLTCLGSRSRVPSTYPYNPSLTRWTGCHTFVSYLDDSKAWVDWLPYSTFVSYLYYSKAWVDWLPS